MLYSCFDAPRGEYRVFENSKTQPANGDLSVPRLSSLFVGNIGVPAMDAGRPLPSDAQYVGHAPNAQGMIVNCEGGMSGFGEVSPTTAKVIGIGILVLAGYGLIRLVF